LNSEKEVHYGQFFNFIHFQQNENVEKSKQNKYVT